MNDFGTVMILFALLNKNGFNSIKNAVKTAEKFSTQISNLTNIMSVLPSLGNMIPSKENPDNAPQQKGEEYVDTLKDILSLLK